MLYAQEIVGRQQDGEEEEDEECAEKIGFSLEDLKLAPLWWLWSA